MAGEDAAVADTSNAGPHPGYTPVRQKALLTGCLMLAAVMQSLDTTIANVALPHIQASLAATQEEVAWVITSYLIAAAVMYPLTGWLANRFGRRQVFLISLTAFVAASALCGAATSLPELVMFRLLQGIGGAALVPLSMAIMFEINLSKDYGRAMSIWGIGATLAPVLGPTLGGYITDSFTWRWCFYVNLPVGLLAFAGLYATLPRSRNLQATRFDAFGFATLSVAVAGLQLMLDRGPLLDWFSSREVITEAVVAATSFYLFLVHTLSSDRPFVSPALFRDRNFVVGNVFLFLIGVTLFTTGALNPSLLQTHMNYPVVLAGLVLGPRGLGTITGMFIVGRLVPRVDVRIVMAIGMGITAFSLWQMTRYSLEMDAWPVIVAGVFQGLGIGSVNVCLTTVAFTTLPPRLRNEGTGMASLVRYTGGATGLSVMVFLLTQNTQRMHAALATHITPYNMTANPAAKAAHVEVLTTRGMMALDSLITNQSAMIAYVDDFKLLMVFTLLTLPFVLLFKRPRA